MGGPAGKGDRRSGGQVDQELDSRYVPLDGCHNFRDLGGYARAGGGRLRRGVVFRSDALHYLSDADVRHLRDVLGVRAVVDVRRHTEVRLDGNGRLAGPPVAYHHVPFLPERPPGAARAVPDDLAELYLHMLEWGGRAVARVIDLIGSSRDPLVFHCAAGKDRTGVISAVILGLLGVSESDIVDDYAWTSRNLDRIVERLRASESYQAIFTDLPPSTLHAEPETMRSLLELVRQRFGSMRGYAEEIGLDDAALARLESRLVG